MGGQLLIGTSGWVYRHWYGPFYPAGLARDQLLPFYAARFRTVEINYSFYRLPSRENFEAWRSATPDDFVFAVKASRYLTHVRRLRDAAEPLNRLLGSARGLGPKLGPLLFQFPGDWPHNQRRLEDFLALLPAGDRCAFEFRHASWLVPEVYQALAAHECALCIPDSPTLPQDRQVTAPYVYLRMHSGRFSANYTDAELARWVGWLAGRLAEGLDVYVYFNNDVAGYAVANALRLGELLRELA